MHLLQSIRNTSWQLWASFSVNLLLAVALSVVWRAHQVPAMNPNLPTAATKGKSATPAKATPLAANPAAFHWRQLDAPDFPTYVRNLRSIGCPEATIHDIIQGELKEIYVARRQEVERELAATPSQSRAFLQQRLQQLTAEEAAMLKSSLGSGASAVGAAADTSSSSSQTSGPQGVGATATGNTVVKPAFGSLTPAAFLVGNDPRQPAPADARSTPPNDPRLNQATAAVISQMRQDFVNSLQNAGADPSSPVYRQRWLSAQRASDERFSSMFGGDYFIKSQLEAVRNAPPTKP